MDELLFEFTHTVGMPWILPGVPPTGKRVRIPLVVVVKFEGAKLLAERIYWDQASLLNPNCVRFSSRGGSSLKSAPAGTRRAS